jgi:hypothetical protein
VKIVQEGTIKEVKGRRKVWEAARIGGRGGGRFAGERWEGHGEG